MAHTVILAGIASTALMFAVAYAFGVAAYRMGRDNDAPTYSDEYGWESPSPWQSLWWIGSGITLVAFLLNCLIAWAVIS